MTSFAKETLPVTLEEEMRRSYLDYAMSVIVGRALPDARDPRLQEQLLARAAATWLEQHGVAAQSATG